MAVNTIKKRKPKQKKSAPPSVISLTYNLAELPTSQHRAGLAGLVLMVNWMTEQRKTEGVLRITHLDDQAMSLEVDEIGMKSLFSETYDFIEGEIESEKLRTRTKSKAIIQPKRTITKELILENGDKKEIPIHIYPTYVPKGAFLTLLDPTSDNSAKGIWVDLWRDFVWRVIRKKDPSRGIYRDRSKATKEAVNTWKEIVLETTSREADGSDLSSTDLIGARESNAERISFRDTPRNKLLLNFWPFSAQVYIPVTTVIDKKTKQPRPEEAGYALAIPEVGRLETFCKILPKVLNNNRGTEAWGYRQRPRDSVIDLPAEGALDFFLKLSEQISLQEGAKGISRVVTAVDIVHMDASGQDVSIVGTSRVEPESFNPDEYERVRRNLKNREFRRQRVINILTERKWYADFDHLLARLPFKLGFDAEYFSRDAKESFKNEVRDLEDTKMSDETNSPFGTQETNTVTGKAVVTPPKSIAVLVYQTVGRYLDRKLIAKRKFGYSDVMSGLADKDEYSKERRALAINAFHSVKSRSGEDFIEYFANTLCSVSQSMSEADYVSLAKALHDDAEGVRTLTLLALSARS